MIHTCDFSRISNRFMIAANVATEKEHTCVQRSGVRLRVLGVVGLVCVTQPCELFFDMNTFHCSVDKTNRTAGAVLVVDCLPAGHVAKVSYRDTKLVTDTLDNFFKSKDHELDHRHVQCLQGIGGETNRKPPAPPESWVLHNAKKCWETMKKDPQTTRHPIQITHAGYLKLFQLMVERDLRNNENEKYDVIMLDEAQDSNDCTVDIVLQERRKGCGVIMLGDPHQVGLVDTCGEPHTPKTALVLAVVFGRTRARR